MQSLLVWLAITAIEFTSNVYGFRRRAQFQISMKQDFQSFFGVTVRVMITAVVLGFVARGLMFVTATSEIQHV